MRQITMNVHGVEHVKIKPVRPLPESLTTRTGDIIITCQDGVELRLALFVDDEAKATVVNQDLGTDLGETGKGESDA